MECKDTTLLSLIGQAVYSCKVCDVPFVNEKRLGRPYSRCEQHRAKKTREWKRTIEFKAIPIRLRLTMCLMCGDKMKPGRIGTKKRFCSRSCSQTARNRRALRDGIGAYAEKHHRKCAMCPKRIASVKKVGISRYCSKECRQRSWMTQADCGVCGNVFFRRRGSNQLCSRRCARESQKRNAPQATYTCKVCDTSFTCVKQANRRFCGITCHNAYYKKRRNLIYNAARRMNEAGNTTRAETIVPIEVFKRDNWTCWICTLPIDRSQSWPEPLSATVDHVIPITKGGEHTMANVRCAHNRCNIIKRNNIIGGLDAIGTTVA